MRIKNEPVEFKSRAVLVMVILSWIKDQLSISEYRDFLVNLGVHPRQFQSDSLIHQIVAFRLINSTRSWHDSCTF